MEAKILTGVVHAGCGGKVRERLYPELLQAQKDRIDMLFVHGRITEARADHMRANLTLDKDRVLECLFCGEETAIYGSADKPMRNQIQLQVV